MNPKAQQSSFQSAHRSALALFSALLVALAGTGCGSLGGPGSASFASVKIQGHSTEEIEQATTQVFLADGYTGGPTGGGQMVFQKEGTRMNTLAYEGLAATQAGSTTLVRVKAEVVNLSADTRRLQCQAYMVRGAGDSFFEEEQRLTNIRSGPYQSLLNKVAGKLK